MAKKSPYLAADRLADVLALIQVLALDKDTHRSESGLKDELRGTPRSINTWSELAQAHPEFFRVAADSKFGVSLVARHVLPKDDTGYRPLPADYTSKLLQLAIDLHDRAVRRSQYWHVWVPLIVAVTAGVFTLFGIWLRSALGGT
jgi:hypothetical protein